MKPATVPICDEYVAIQAALLRNFARLWNVPLPELSDRELVEQFQKEARNPSTLKGP